MGFRESTSNFESHDAVILSSETLKMDQVLHLYRNRRQTLGLARSATLSSIIMRLCWVLVAIYLSCRAFFRRPISCSCRRFVSDCVSFSSCNQLVIIGPRMKWRFRQLSFPLANWYGDVIWIFDPGIIGNQIDKEGESKRYFMQTPVHSIVLRQGQRIWWREITLSLISRIYLGKILPWISLLIKVFGRSLSIEVFGRPLVVDLSASLCVYLHETRFRRWYSSFQQLWALAITKEDVISCCWRCLMGSDVTDGSQPMIGSKFIGVSSTERYPNKTVMSD